MFKNILVGVLDKPGNLADKTSNTLAAILDTSLITKSVVDNQSENDIVCNSILGLNSDIEIELTENNLPILNGAEVFINSIPAMPNLSINIKAIKYKSVSFKLIIEYSSSFFGIATRSITKLISEVGKVFDIDTNRQYPIDFGDTIVGGNATIRIFEKPDGSNLLAEFKFVIKGSNPTETEVTNYLSDQGYDWWFLLPIIKQESNCKQFAIKTQTLYANKHPERNTKGFPQFGYPDGFGLMKIDHSSEYKHTTIPNMDYFWNWKKNIDAGAAIVRSKISMAKTDLKSEINKFIKDWSKDKSLIIGAPDKSEGKITFVHAPTSITGFDEINKYFQSELTLDDTTKSFIDAQIIRRYNGGKFYKVQYDDKAKKWQWNIDDFAKKNKTNYVQEVCNKI